MVGKIGSDVRLGVVAFLAVAPPVYALQLLLVQWFESHHPLVEMLRKDPQPHLIAACIVSAVVVAPVAEEYLFRGLLQGWLERLAAGRDPSRELLCGRPHGRCRRRSRRASRPRRTVASSNSSDTAPHVLARSGTLAEATRRVEIQRPGRAYWPMAVSALIFAVLHLSHGPDWIPLFFLALGLGYLYRQTHRILPCIVVHFLLNACSMACFSSRSSSPTWPCRGTLGMFGL